MNYHNDYTIYYRISHYILGGLIALNIKNIVGIIILLIILLYQFLQYYLNVRYFAMSNTFKSGNSVGHTIKKLLDYLIGFILVLIIKISFNLNE